MLTKIPFKRVVRRFNKCLSITLPKGIADYANVQHGKEFKFTILVELPDPDEDQDQDQDQNKKEKPVITSIAT